MLEPREADIPALFLVLVVLPLVTYFLLGKWHETSKKNERIRLLAQLAAEEALRAEKMAPMAEIPVGSSSKTGFHECARCFGPATTRCARCKSVRYCSGKCQIIHWRQGHKQECQQLDTSNLISSPSLVPISRSAIPWVSQNENQTPTFFKYDTKGPKLDGIPSKISSHLLTPSTDKSHMFQVEQKLSDKQARNDLNSDREILESEVKASFHNVEKAIGNIRPTQSATHSTTSLPSKEGSTELKDLANEVGSFGKCDTNSPAEFVQLNSVPGCTLYGPRKLKSQNGSGFHSSCPVCILEPLLYERNGTSPTFDCQSFFREEGYSSNEPSDLSSSSKEMSFKDSSRSKTLSHNLDPAHAMPQRSMLRESREYSCFQTDRKACMENPSEIPQSGPVTIPLHRSNRISKTGDMKMAGPRKLLRLSRRAPAEDSSDSLTSNKVLFPYEEFVKLFHYEAVDFSPRGLLNCGNSCYANAVLQCLTCTRPLIIYLLRKSHSGTCWTRDWCLMCELEQHVLNLVEGGGPLSLIGILSHMRNVGCQMGGGNQEDAHEFLRLLVTSMQSICLEGLGEEKEIDLRLQETTFIQQTFGGCLRSKVKCLRCQHESERYENIMDLTLEILGWVESLEDALAQFTAPEDLDGDNMYRCGRCMAYVKARKQLSIHDAPNILTIVLKRFQTGKYGKINKCITFPDLLDMIPYMAGTGDSPPLYVLYGVVVHLDTLNASFSGHYVSYVKDLQGTWFRVDDTEVEPVSLSQVMSEGAYILFYSRSFPRPPSVYSNRRNTTQPPASAKCSTPKTQRSSRQRQSKSYNISEFSSPIHSANMGNDPESQTTGITNRTANQFLSLANRNILSTKETFSGSVSMEFSDFTSSDGPLFTSDGSHFTSSDDASFTTESNRDSISTVDYADSVTLDPVSSIFSPFYFPEYHCSSVS